MGSEFEKAETSNIRDNVKQSRVGTHLEKPVFCSQSGFDMLFIS